MPSERNPAAADEPDDIVEKTPSHPVTTTLLIVSSVALILAIVLSMQELGYYVNKSTRSELNTSRGEKETAEAQVARLISQKAALEKDLAEVRKDYSDTKQRLLDMQLVMEELERQGIPVGTLVVNHKPVPPINGKVAGVKTDVSPALVLLTVGKDDKVEKGFQFTVYRGAEFVGKVVVEKVNADSAGCRVLFSAPGKVIKAGDDVATRLD